MIRRLSAVAATAGLIVLGLAGCGSDAKDNGATAPTATAGTSGARVDVGNTINYGSFGTKAEIDCGADKSLNIGGSNNTLTVSGTCTSVNVGGSDNKVTLEKVGQTLTVVGLNNTVVYHDGEPKIDNLGSGNDIRKG